MCAIAGLLDLRAMREVDRDALTRMANAMSHRGPDGEGFHIDAGIGLAHRRLAIIDPEGGVQPFHSRDSHHVLSYNGETYNYPSLAKELTQAGTQLKTNSDTEVIAEGLAQQDDLYIEKLQGMFAFAFWNNRTKSLLLARDRLGEKPLYYGVSQDGWLVFASELGALTASGMFEEGLNKTAIADYFHFGYVPDPASIYENIYKLEPGHKMIVHRARGPEQVQSQPYWSIDFTADPQLSFSDACEELTQLLDRSVHDQMISDVPLGAFLSGGVDSSAIVASMSRKIEKPITCSIGFNESSHDERSYAREVATRYATNHHEEVANLDIASLIDKIANSYGEPFSDSSALPTYIVSKLARQQVTVALSGDGGDEVFAGYRRYRFFLGEEKLRRHLPLGIRRALFGTLGNIYPKLDFAPRPLRFKTTFQALGEDQASAYARASSIMLPERARALLSPDFLNQLGDYDYTNNVRRHMNDAHTNDPLGRALYCDLKTWLSGRMLVKTDRASMANSLEVRTPLLDHRLVEWAAQLPSNFKLDGNNGKRILKSSMEQRLSNNILYRTKQGFALPVNDWLRAKTDNPLERLQENKLWRESGMLNESRVESMMSDHQQKRMDYGQELWSVLMFDAFLQNSQPSLA